MAIISCGILPLHFLLVLLFFFAMRAMMAVNNPADFLTLNHLAPKPVGPGLS
jgi:hypothetical protein